MGQDVRGYATYVDGIHIGMMMAAINYSCKKDGIKIPSYLWYICKSPDLRSIENEVSIKNNTKVRVPFLKLMSKILYDDISSVHKKKKNTQLTHWLRSDPHGGKVLKQTYIDNGYIPCDIGLDGIISARIGMRSNYFYYPTHLYQKIKKHSIVNEKERKEA